MAESIINVPVRLGERSYNIEVGSRNLLNLGAAVVEKSAASHAVVITDRNVVDPYGVAAVESLFAAGVRVDLVTADPGEEMKSVETARVLWDSLAQAKADRHTVVVAVGGGVIGDLAGFVAATYARGLRFWQVPTTLLAQVDSSVGGKVGINLSAGKNLVGSFWQPLGVTIDIAALTTLPERDYLSGLAEVVKYGVILDADFFAYLENHVAELLARDRQTLQEIVAQSCRIKAGVVEKDEREETGLRAALNYGHTIGHAFEVVSSYGTLLHGEAISIGMHLEARLAQALGRVDAAFVNRQQSLLENLRLPIAAPSADPQSLVKAMGLDKKNTSGELNFVLPTRIGSVQMVKNVNPSMVQDILR